MSIASELNALNGYILGAYDEINTKGGTVPANKNMANLASAIASISGGGGGGGGNIAMGTFTTGSTAETTHTITHGLGVLPKTFACWAVASEDFQDDFSSSKSKHGACYYICLTKFNSSGRHGRWYRRTSSSSITYGVYTDDDELATGTKGAAYSFNMDTNTATIKSQDSTYGLGLNRTFFWIAVADINEIGS